MMRPCLPKTEFHWSCFLVNSSVSVPTHLPAAAAWPAMIHPPRWNANASQTRHSRLLTTHTGGNVSTAISWTQRRGYWRFRGGEGVDPPSRTPVEFAQNDEKLSGPFLPPKYIQLSASSERLMTVEMHKNLQSGTSYLKKNSASKALITYTEEGLRCHPCSDLTP